MSRRTDDYDRSARITRDAYEYAQREDSDPEFASLMLGSMVEQGSREERGTYPPDGHDYPASGR
ncbi:hypothetical protein [Streptomyces triculaminicus]|uniref:hypothetical protein n=1 Tax=Streptomyces triculaminicus TaxID=2816232 RepID=UPI0037D211EF